MEMQHSWHYRIFSQPNQFFHWLEPTPNPNQVNFAWRGLVWRDLLATKSCDAAAPPGSSTKCQTLSNSLSLLQSAASTFLVATQAAWVEQWYFESKICDPVGLCIRTLQEPFVSPSTSCCSMWKGGFLKAVLVMRVSVYKVRLQSYFLPQVPCVTIAFLSRIPPRILKYFWKLRTQLIRKCSSLISPAAFINASFLPECLRHG